MFKVKNVRPGILCIPDAGLNCLPGQIIEIEEETRQIMSAISSGYLVKVAESLGEKVLQENKEPSLDDRPAKAVDIASMSAAEAISMVKKETDPGQIKELISTESRRTVIDALKNRLKEVDGAQK